MTRDILARVTHEPYVYVFDDPLNEIDPSGLWTIGLCGNANGGFWIGGGVQGCIVFDKNGASLTRTLAIGAQTPSAGVSGSLQISDASGAYGLSGPFSYSGLSVGGKNIGGQYAQGKDCHGNDVHVLEGSIGAGPSPGFELHAGESWTSVSPTISYDTFVHLLRQSVILF